MPDIASCVQCQSEMDVTSAGPFNRVRCPSCDTEMRVKVDFGNYLLQKRLAYGGMSVLFVAIDQTLGREVALKVLNEDYSQDEVRTAQFEREAEATALVSHPNVVRVYSVGRAYDRFYIAMELIAGESLEKKLEYGRGLPEKQVLHIALQVAAGLKAAKASGLIHRDIKPGNILVDEENTAKIVDFGLSIVTQSGQARASEIFATPYYAPPEALEARVEDFRSDIYALGATLYHALAGSGPISTTSTNTRTLLEAKQQTPPLRHVAPQVSQSTSDLVARMMAFHRDDRCTSYDEVTAGIHRALNGELQPIPSPRRKTSRQGSAQNQVWLIGLVVLGLMLLGFFAMTRRTKSDPEEHVARPQNPPAAPVADEAQQIAKTYERAREALRDGRFQVAEMNFLKLTRQAEVPEPTGTWAGFEAGLSALLDGRSGDATVSFSRLREGLGQAQLNAATESALVQFLGGWDKLEPFPVESGCPANAELALVSFGKSLKNWEQGDRRALAFFAEFSAQTFTEKQDWLEVYQDWARKLTADGRLLVINEPAWTSTWSFAELEAELMRLRELSQKLKTNGRARFNVESWQAELHSLRARKRNSGGGEDEGR